MPAHPPRLSTLLLGAAALAPLATLAACDGVSISPDGAQVRFTGEQIPLLPPGFPVYPKAFSTQALDTVVEEAIADVTVKAAIQSVAGEVCKTFSTSWGDYTVCLDELMNRARYDTIDRAIREELPELWDWIAGLVTGQLRFYDPGPMATGVNEQLGRIFKGRVTFDEVRLSMTVANRTDGLWAVPVRLKLYAGDGGAVTARQGLVTATGEAVVDSGDPQMGISGSDDYTVLLQPGDRVTLTTDNMEGLVTALNEFRGFAVDYDADVELTDIEGAAFRQWLGASKADADGNGVADALSGWGLVLEDFRITVSGTGEVEFPTDLPDWLDRYIVE